MDLDRCYLLFSNCIPVRGYTRAIICDLTRNKIDFIPIELYKILKKKNRKIRNILAKFNAEEKDIIKEYFYFLLKKEYIYMCDKKMLRHFPPLNDTWENPNLITNLIVEYTSSYDLLEIINKIEELGNFNVQIRFKDEVTYETLLQLFERMEKRRINSIELILPFNKDNNILINRINNCSSNIVKIIFFNATENKVFDNTRLHVIYTTQNILAKGHCGFISPDYFKIDIYTYSESKHFNNCLNRKLCINEKGELMNCLNINKSYGNVFSTDIKRLVMSKEFKFFGGIKKDRIEVCKDCEFRYICTDCRASISNKENIFSRPIKCTYNPYIAKWKGEEGFISVEECALISNNNKFKINRKKVRDLNFELWS